LVDGVIPEKLIELQGQVHAAISYFAQENNGIEMSFEFHMFQPHFNWLNVRDVEADRLNAVTAAIDEVDLIQA
ncbi:MAG: hypothetical protein P8J33_00985, partial [Pirellulaceae bacterium]|nr:hypothetical protein [Pirellulaceae bacterium]